MSFWANKLNGEPTKAPVIPTRDMFGVNSYTTLETKFPQQSIQEDYKPKARLKQGGNCPDCGSDKYLPYGSYAIACGECGYHPRFEQSGHGERSLQTKPGEAQPARQAGDSQTMQGSIAILNSGGGDHIGSV